MNIRLYAPAPDPDTFTAPDMVMEPPVKAVEPTASVPAVILPRIPDVTFRLLAVVPDAPTITPMEPVGAMVTVPVPAFIAVDTVRSLVKILTL